MLLTHGISICYIYKWSLSTTKYIQFLPHFYYFYYFRGSRAIDVVGISTFSIFNQWNLMWKIKYKNSDTIFRVLRTLENLEKSENFVLVWKTWKSQGFFSSPPQKYFFYQKKFLYIKIFAISDREISKFSPTMVDYIDSILAISEE